MIILLINISYPSPAPQEIYWSPPYTKSLLQSAQGRNCQVVTDFHAFTILPIIKICWMAKCRAKWWITVFHLVIAIIYLQYISNYPLRDSLWSILHISMHLSYWITSEYLADLQYSVMQSMMNCLIVFLIISHVNILTCTYYIFTEHLYHI